MLFIFLFRAEDGIRDWSVTGVQTCALPISLAGQVHAREAGLEARPVLADQAGRQVVGDGVVDALGRFLVPRRAADGGGLAKARGAIAQPQLHDHRALPADGAERQLVRTDGGNVEDPRLDALDQETVLNGGGVCLGWRRRRGRNKSENPCIVWIY